MSKPGPIGAQEDPLNYQISPEFAQIIDRSKAYLQNWAKLNHANWNMGQEKTYAMDQDSGILSFLFENGTEARCPFQAIGSFDEESRTWAWAWANPSIGPHLLIDAKKTCGFGKKHNFEMLTEPYWLSDLRWAWRMTAVAASGCRAEGAFCAQMGPLNMFLTFRNVEILNP
ncbi:MAG: hypothetical protein KIS92_01395 [Planctomycetota bacterium]|nr:hypothetical protein [Planctomycetota bacterium]